MIVICVFALLIVASKPMFMPLALVLFSVRMLSMLVSVKSVLEALALIASVNVSVMFVVLSVSVSPSAGLNTGASTLVSTVNVAFAVSPWLPATS